MNFPKWSFVGVDIDEKSLQHAEENLQRNDRWLKHEVFSSFYFGISIDLLSIRLYRRDFAENSLRIRRKKD